MTCGRHPIAALEVGVSHDLGLVVDIMAVVVHKNQARGQVGSALAEPLTSKGVYRFNRRLTRIVRNAAKGETMKLAYARTKVQKRRVVLYKTV